ncbi:MAG: alpha/beta hydrolase [Lachnospiraceae bacterium]|nr:alpha/beta hydrolase [Lachnospiraceae bacterium]
MQVFFTVLLWVSGTALVLYLAGTLVIAFLMYDVAFAREMPSYGSAVLSPSAGDSSKPSEDDLKHRETFRQTLEWVKTQDTEDWTEISYDGLKLHATHIRPEGPSHKAVIVVHGYHAQGLWDFDGMVPHYVASGFHVVVPDDRAHNRSEGKYLGFGWNDRRDIVQWVRHTVRELGEGCDVVLHGVSMGGAAVMNTSGEPDLPPQVRCVIEDCGFSSQIAQFTHIFPIKWMAPTVLFWDNMISKVRNGYFLYEASSLKQLARTDRPFLFIHGAEDTFVPTRMVYENYAACASKEKELSVTEGAAHAMSYTHNPEAYKARVDAFIAKHL